MSIQVKFFKPNSLPETLEPNSFYFLEDGDNTEAILTSETGEAKRLTNTEAVTKTLNTFLTGSSEAQALTDEDNFLVTQLDVVVSGAGSAGANGVYTYRGQYNGKPYYNKDGQNTNPLSNSIRFEGVWIISILEVGFSGQYMSIDVPDSVVNVEEWDLNDTEAPTPALTEQKRVKSISRIEVVRNFIGDYVISNSTNFTLLPAHFGKIILLTNAGNINCNIASLVNFAGFVCEVRKTSANNQISFNVTGGGSTVSPAGQSVAMPNGYTKSSTVKGATVRIDSADGTTFYLSGDTGETTFPSENLLFKFIAPDAGVANGGTFATLADQSGNGNHAANFSGNLGTYDAAAINGCGGIDVGTNKVYQLADMFGGLTQAELFVVMALRASPPSLQNSTHITIGGFCSLPYTNNSLYDGFGGSEYVAANPSPNFTTPRLFNSARGVSTRVTRIDGVQVSSQSDLGAASFASRLIGGKHLDQTMDGWFGAIVIYSVVNDTETRTQINNALKSIFNLSY